MSGGQETVHAALKSVEHIDGNDTRGILRHRKEIYCYYDSSQNPVIDLSDDSDEDPHYIPIDDDSDSDSYECNKIRRNPQRAAESGVKTLISALSNTANDVVKSKSRKRSSDLKSWKCNQGKLMKAADFGLRSYSANFYVATAGSSQSQPLQHPDDSKSKGGNQDVNLKSHIVNQNESAATRNLSATSSPPPLPSIDAGLKISIPNVERHDQQPAPPQQNHHQQQHHHQPQNEVEIEWSWPGPYVVNQNEFADRNFLVTAASATLAFPGIEADFKIPFPNIEKPHQQPEPSPQQQPQQNHHNRNQKQHHHQTQKEVKKEWSLPCSYIVNQNDFADRNLLVTADSAPPAFAAINAGSKIPIPSIEKLHQQPVPSRPPSQEQPQQQSQQNQQQQHHQPHEEVEKERSWSCPCCEVPFKTASELQAHLSAHTKGEKTVPCDICGKYFATGDRVRIHVKAAHGEKSCSCEICGSGFSYRCKLLHHMRTHTGDKPFHCEVCGKKFSQKNHLTRHSMIHTGERPHPCDFCGKGFYRKDKLSRHRRIHTGERVTGQPRRCGDFNTKISQGAIRHS